MCSPTWWRRRPTQRQPLLAIGRLRQSHLPMLVMNIALDLRGGGGRRRQRGRRAELLAQIYRTFTSFERERFPGAQPISTEYRRDRTGSDISVWWLKKSLSGVSSLSTQQHCDAPSLEWRRQIDCCRFLDILRRYLKITGKRSEDESPVLSGSTG